MTIEEQITSKMNELKELRSQLAETIKIHDREISDLHDKQFKISVELLSLRTRNKQQFLTAWLKTDPIGKAWLFKSTASSVPFKLYEVLGKNHILYTWISVLDSDVIMASKIVPASQDLLETLMTNSPIDGVSKAYAEMKQFMLKFDKEY